MFTGVGGVGSAGWTNLVNDRNRATDKTIGLKWFTLASCVPPQCGTFKVFKILLNLLLNSVISLLMLTVGQSGTLRYFKTIQCSIFLSPRYYWHRQQWNYSIFSCVLPSSHSACQNTIMRSNYIRMVSGTWLPTCLVNISPPTSCLVLALVNATLLTGRPKTRGEAQPTGWHPDSLRHILTVMSCRV